MEENKEVTNNEILEALNELNSNTIATNNSIKELNEYLIVKERKEAEVSAAEDAKKDIAAEKKEAETRDIQAEESAKQDQQNEVYTELLFDIRDDIRLNNQMLAGSFIFFGIICGVLLFKILWDKMN